MKTVLFVCTGNTCRSPMAAGLFNKLAEQRKKPLYAYSAGKTPSGSRASENATRVAREHGFDLSAHIPQQLSEEHVRKADLILTMEEHHKQHVEACFPNAKGKTFMLLEFVGEQGGVNDPFNGELDEYRLCARQLETAICRLLDRFPAEE